MNNHKSGFVALPLIIIVLVLIGAGAYFWSQKATPAPAPVITTTAPPGFTPPTTPPPLTPSVAETARTCIYGKGKLSCNYDWDLVIKGKTTRLAIDIPVSVPEGILVGLADPRDTKNAQLLFTSEGKQEINELTSRKATGAAIASGFQPTPSSTQECENKIKEFDKADCYNLLAAKTKDPSICPKITVSDEKDKCYFIIASKTKDVSFCQKIGKDENKQICVTLVSSFK